MSVTLPTAPNFFLMVKLPTFVGYGREKRGVKRAPPPLLVEDQADRTRVLAQYRVETEHVRAVSGGPRAVRPCLCSAVILRDASSARRGQDWGGGEPPSVGTGRAPAPRQGGWRPSLFPRGCVSVRAVWAGPGLRVRSRSRFRAKSWQEAVLTLGEAATGRTGRRSQETRSPRAHAHARAHARARTQPLSKAFPHLFQLLLASRWHGSGDPPLHGLAQARRELSVAYDARREPRTATCCSPWVSVLVPLVLETSRERECRPACPKRGRERRQQGGWLLPTCARRRGV